MTVLEITLPLAVAVLRSLKSFVCSESNWRHAKNNEIRVLLYI